MDNNKKALIACPGCGGHFPDSNGPTHPYMQSSAGCWKYYGEVLAREYQNPALFAGAHRLTVDAYAIQHPGDPDERRAYQSVRLHYLSLHLIFKHNWDLQAVTQKLESLLNRPFNVLPEPPGKFDMTVLDAWQSDDAHHADTIRRWAHSAYTAWSCLSSYAEETIGLSD